MLFVPLMAIGQGGDGDMLKKCFIDSKTGDTIIGTRWVHVQMTPNSLLNFRMTRTNSVFTFDLAFHFGKGPDFNVPKGDSIWVKFTSGVRTVLFAQDSVKSYVGGAKIPQEPEGGITTGAKVSYNATFPQVYAFAGNEIEKIRIFSSLGYKDLVWITKSRDLSMKAANLMLEKWKKFKVCEDEPETELPMKDNQKKDNF